MEYNLYLKSDDVYPWDTEELRTLGPWHIASNIEEFAGYIKAFGIPTIVSMYGTQAIEAAIELMIACYAIDVALPTCYGTKEALEYINLMQ